jgi:predicted PurR-regulated permease PerM
VTSPEEHRQRRLIVRAVTVALTGLLLVWLLFSVRRVLLLLYVAGLLAVGFSPIVRQIERRRGQRKRRLPRWAAILVLYLGVMLTIAGMLSILVPPLIEQARALWANLPELVSRGQETLRRWGIWSGELSWAELARSLPSPELAITGVFSALQSLLGVIGALVTVFVLPYYLLIEADDLHKTFLSLFAEERRPQVARISRTVTEKVGAWLGGQLLLALVIGSTAALGLKLLGVPYFWVLALVAAIGEMIPVVGPILAAIPAILVGLTVSPQTGMVVAAYFALQQFIENNFLVPRIMERQVGVSAITVVVALLIGTELLGFVGALLAVPTAAIAQVLFQEFMKKDDVAS